jgi:hypothetical protein
MDAFDFLKHLSGKKVLLNPSSFRGEYEDTEDDAILDNSAGLEQAENLS